MAGIAIQLKRIFKRGTVVSMLEGVGYSTMTTIAPMLIVILNLLAMYRVLDVATISFAQRELLSCSILYVFIFSLLVTSPFNAVLSRYVADSIYEERYEEVMPCFYTGLLLNILAAAMLAIPFYLWEIFRGGVDPVFVFTTFCMFMGMVLVFYGMLYLSTTKDYVAISAQFIAGMVLAFLLSLLFTWALGMPVIYAIQLSLAIGFFFTAVLEFAFLRGYFRESSGNYGRVLSYFRTYWKLFVTNLAYTLGLFCHNFVFWGTGMQMRVAGTYVCAQPYDMASCIAMFTNISATVITIVLIETKFHDVYQRYSEYVIGGKLADIQKEKSRMFRRLSQLFTRLAELQFMISVIVFLVCVVFLPNLGLAGQVMTIYPSLAAAYFVTFFMYSGILLLYYFDDLTGACLAAVVFLLVTLGGTLFSSRLTEAWYGIGLLLGAFTAWMVCYARLHWLEKNFDAHIFCRGKLLDVKENEMPDPVVYRRPAAAAAGGGKPAGVQRQQSSQSDTGRRATQEMRPRHAGGSFPGESRQSTGKRPAHAADEPKKADKQL